MQTILIKAGEPRILFEGVPVPVDVVLMSNEKYDAMVALLTEASGYLRDLQGVGFDIEDMEQWIEHYDAVMYGQPDPTLIQEEGFFDMMNFDYLSIGVQGETLPFMIKVNGRGVVQDASDSSAMQFHVDNMDELKVNGDIYLSVPGIENSSLPYKILSIEGEFKHQP